MQAAMLLSDSTCSIEKLNSICNYGTIFNVDNGFKCSKAKRSSTAHCHEKIVEFKKNNCPNSN